MEYLLEKLCIITLSGVIIYGLAYLYRLYANNYMRREIIIHVVNVVIAF